MFSSDINCTCSQESNIQPCCMPMSKLAHAYVPVQTLGCIYPPMKGLSRGTIFPELDMPYGTDPEYMVDQ